MLLEKGQGIRNNFINIENNARKLIEEAQAIRKRSEEIHKTQKEDINQEYEYIYGEKLLKFMGMQLEKIKNGPYHIKKNIRSIKKEIGLIKNDAYIPKITYVKIEKPNVINDIREKIKVLNNDSVNIQNNLKFTKKFLNIFMKREQTNRDNINNTNVIMQNIKKGLYKAKKGYNFTINICKIINNNTVQSNKRK